MSCVIEWTKQVTLEIKVQLGKERDVRAESSTLEEDNDNRAEGSTLLGALHEVRV